MTSTIYFNIGSNIGDRRAFIARAVAALCVGLAGTVQVSTPVESEPWGYASTLPYLNVGVALTIEHGKEWLETDLQTLLATVKVIERSISPMPHRNADGSYADREIDIDIIAIDDVVYSSPGLTIPHPMMGRRAFVLTPMAELAPEWTHPLTGLTAAEMLALI